jgi:O-6-methylguanine DNA methyltransferase
VIHIKHISTPLGLLVAEAGNEGITRLSFLNKQSAAIKMESANDDVNPYLIQLQFEMAKYFKEELKYFTVKINPVGTEFQKQVWNELVKIPYGKTISYLQLARKLNDPDAVRAVAGANSKNPIMILIPCHRVNGTNGSLTGYAGGLPAKKFLLELESAVKTPQQLSMSFPI